MKKGLVCLGLVAAISIITALPARGQIMVDVSYANASDHFITMTVSGSKVISSNSSNNQWSTNAGTSDIWRSLFKVNANNIFASGSGYKIYSAGSGVTASVAGGDSVVMATVMFYTSSGRNDFSIGFDANPDPLFAIGQTVVFSGSAVIDLGTDTAGQFNAGTWTGASTNGSQTFTPQFGGLDLELNINAIPEPSTYILLGLGVVGLVVLRHRQNPP